LGQQHQQHKNSNISPLIDHATRCIPTNKNVGRVTAADVLLQDFIDLHAVIVNA
jgi:hypothetical protein